MHYAYMYYYRRICGHIVVNKASFLKSPVILFYETRNKVLKTLTGGHISMLDALSILQEAFECVSWM